LGLKVIFLKTKMLRMAWNGKKVYQKNLQNFLPSAHQTFSLVLIGEAEQRVKNAQTQERGFPLAPAKIK
jgi:hypothetical protein